MLISKIACQGGLRTQAVHLASGNTLTIDAPKDNNGKGEYFSPTDLAATGLGACMLTIMDLYARRHGLDLSGAEASVEKIMTAAPRRIAEIKVVFEFPKDREFAAEHRQAMERAAQDCPVSRSLHPEIKQNLEFRW